MVPFLPDAGGQKRGQQGGQGAEDDIQNAAGIRLARMQPSKEAPGRAGQEIGQDAQHFRNAELDWAITDGRQADGQGRVGRADDRGQGDFAGGEGACSCLGIPPFLFYDRMEAAPNSRRHAGSIFCSNSIGPHWVWKPVFIRFSPPVGPRIPPGSGGSTRSRSRAADTGRTARPAAWSASRAPAF